MANIIGSSELDSVQICPLCGKPFSPGPPYNRHLSYCRRSQSRSKTRRKSCRACCVAKTKCSFAVPCSRCIAKKLDCTYDRVNIASHAKSHADDQIAHSPSILLTSQRAPSVPGFLGLDDDPVLDLSNFPNISSFPYDGAGGGDVEVVFSDLIRENLPTDDFQSFLTSYSTTTGDLFIGDLESTKQLDFLTRLSPSKPLSQQGANLLIESLCAVPEQMLRKATFPTFIHPHWDPLAMPEALAVCMQVARMFASRTPEVKSFIWRTILAEQRRHLEELPSRSKQDLLAMIQAQMVYLVMRVVDGGTESSSWNQEMVTSMTILCERFLYLCDGRFSESEQDNPSKTWEDWIFAGSRRRTSCVWFLITHVFVVKTINGCPTTEAPWTIPLPSPKTQWEARTRADWMEEIEAGTPAIRLYGNLLESRKRCNETLHAQKLDSWNARTDNLGFLLNVGAALI